MNTPSEGENVKPKSVSGKYTKDQYTQEQWEALIIEENGKWAEAGMQLDGHYALSGTEMFMMQCKMQAIINCIISNEFSEEALNLNMNMIVLESMESVREHVEPQIRQARLAALQGNIVPKIYMPWERPNGEVKEG